MPDYSGMGGYYAQDFFEEPDGLVVEGKRIQSTVNAILWVAKDGRWTWIPRSQVLQEMPDAVIITHWLASRANWHKPKTKPKAQLELPFDLNDVIPF